MLGLLAVVLLTTASAQLPPAADLDQPISGTISQHLPLPVRPRSRSVLPEFNFRSGAQRLNANPLWKHQEKMQGDFLSSQASSQEPLVITEPQPGQEYVSFVKGDLQTQQKPRSEILLITEPILGQEYVSFGPRRENVKDSVISARDGEIFYINIDEPQNATSEISVAEHILDTEPQPAASPAKPNVNYDYENTATIIPDYYNYDEQELIDNKMSLTESSLSNMEENNNIEILTPNAKSLPAGSAVNELYGKYFDEADLSFGKGQNEDDKSLVPAESKVRSKFEIKEVNGQLYEYEYRYYYDDEVPQYDYDVVGNFPDSPGNSSSLSSSTSKNATAAPTTATATTALPVLTTTEESTAIRTSSRSRNRNRGSGAITPPVQENAIIPQTSRSRSRGQPISSRSRAELDNTVSTNTLSHVSSDRIIDNTISGNNVEQAQLPTHTRFPPRITTSAPQPRSFGAPFIPGFQEAQEILPTDSAVNNEFTTTMSPATRSLVNLYALSQAADAEDISSSTIPNPVTELETIVPYDYLDAYYDYDYSTASNLLAARGITETTDYADLITTPVPTTSTSTTTTTTTTLAPTTTTATTAEAPISQIRSRGNLRSSFSRSGTSRLPSRPITDTVEEESSTASSTVSAAVPLRRGSDRFSSGLSSSPDTNRFRSFSRTSRRNNGEKSSANDSLPATESALSTTEQITTASVASNTDSKRPNRFSRPKPNFKPKINLVPTTEKPSSATKPKATNSRSRSRLFSRLQKGRNTNTDDVETTESTVAEEVAVDTNSSNQETPVAEVPQVSTTTTTTQSSRQRGFGRNRLNRGGLRNNRIQETTQKVEETQDKVANEIDKLIEGDVEEVKTDIQTTTGAPRRAGSRLGSGRPSTRFNSRGRGKDRTEIHASSSTSPSPLVEDDIVVEDGPEVVSANPEESAGEETKEETKLTAGNGRRPASRRAGSFPARPGRLRGRENLKDDVINDTKTTTVATPTTRRSSLIGNRRKRPSPSRRRGGIDDETQEEPVVTSPKEEIPPLDEAVEELPAQGPQVELEAQASGECILFTL